MAGEWSEVTLGELVEIKHGFAFKGEYFSDTPQGDILLTPGNFAVGGGFKADKFKYYDGPEVPEYFLNEGELLVTMTDLSKQADTLGYPAIVPSRSDGRRYLHNQRLGRVLVVDPTRFSARYLYYLMCCKWYRDEILASATGTTVRHTSPERIKRFHFLLPPPEQQSTIAHILGTLDDKIEVNRRMNKTLEAIARAIFKSWFVDFDPVRAKVDGRQPVGMDAKTAALFPDSFEDSAIGKIPAEWEVQKLGGVCEFKYGKALKAGNRIPGPVPVYGSNGRIGWHVEALVKGPGIVVGRKGNPGIVIWVQADFFPIDTAFYVASSEVSLDYLFYALDNLDLASYAADSAVPGLGRNIAYMTDILVPPALIAAEFAAIRRPLLNKVESNNIQNQVLTEIRDTLLPKLISGEIRVKDAEKFVEEHAG